MIRFTPLSSEYLESVTSELHRGSEGDFLCAYLADLCADTDDDFSVAVCLAHGTLLCRRAFSGEYEFTLPYPYLGDADTESALLALEEYARREELPLVYADLTAEDLDALTERYSHPRVHTVPMDDGGEPLYLLEVVTEAMCVEQLPTLTDGELTLRAPDPADLDAYGRLCRDESILAVWGYDFREDYPDATDADLYELTMREFSLGTTLPFFIYYKDAFVGEALLYAFDGRGSAECAIRILPEARRKGIAARTLALIRHYAFDTLGMYRIEGACREQNFPSRALLDRTMTFIDRKDGCLRYHLLKL